MKLIVALKMHVYTFEAMLLNRNNMFWANDMVLTNFLRVTYL